MKKQFIIAITAAAAAVLAYSVIRRKYSKIQSEPQSNEETSYNVTPKTHHLTNAFANAKKHALHAARS